MTEIVYRVQTLRSGQPRPYADTEREYLITVKSTQYGKDGLHPYVPYGDIGAWPESEREARSQSQRDWAKKLVRALCQNFRERDDDDGRTGMNAHFFPTLQSLEIDPRAGTVSALIVEPYTD